MWRLFLVICKVELLTVEGAVQLTRRSSASASQARSSGMEDRHVGMSELESVVGVARDEADAPVEGVCGMHE